MKILICLSHVVKTAKQRKAYIAELRSDVRKLNARLKKEELTSRQQNSIKKDIAYLRAKITKYSSRTFNYRSMK